MRLDGALFEMLDRADSPVDLAAFVLDHGDGSGQPGLVKGVLQGTYQSDLTTDDLLDNITLYWLTNTGVSSSRLYWQNKADFFDAKNISIPFAISVFPDELYQAPRSWAERAYPDNLIYFNELDRGGHFAAWNSRNPFQKRCGPRSDRSDTGRSQRLGIVRRQRGASITYAEAVIVGGE